MKPHTFTTRHGLQTSIGFTLIEIVIFVAGIAVLAVLIVPFLSDRPSKIDLENYQAEALDALREAQSSTTSGRNNVRYGVHFESGKFTLFRGNVYNPLDQDNFDHVMKRVSITGVTLSPGGSCDVILVAGNCDVHFANHRGTPTESGSVVFTSDAGDTKTITIGAAGMFDAN